MRKRANAGTAVLSITIVVVAAIYHLASTPGPVGVVTRAVVAFAVILLLAAMAVAALEARWRWH